MWLVALVSISAVITVGIASNFYVNTISGCDSPLYQRHHGYALTNHVMKDLPLFIADCMAACQQTLSCFSVNYYKNASHGFMCDLNRSTMKQEPGSFVRRSGFEYAEAEKKMYCEKGICHQKDALANRWYKLNSAEFKFISEKKSWQDAKQHCQSLGAKLASLGSELESRFVMESINMTSTGNTTAPSGGGGGSGGSGGGGSTILSIKMDGTDPSEDIRLLNGAKVDDIDSKKAVYFDGQDDFATVPRFSIVGDLTIAFWIKAKVANLKYLFSDYSSTTKKYMFRLYVSMNKLSFGLYDSTGGGIINLFKSTNVLPLNVWVHVAVTWNRSTKEAKIYFNGTPQGSMTSTASDISFYQTNNPRVEIGALGHARKNYFNGWIRELHVIGKALTADDILDIKDNPSSGSAPAAADSSEGVWVGLNDVTTEGTFQWSDGTPLTHNQIQGSDNTNEKDCVYLPKDGDSSNKWMIGECTGEKEFLCKKN